MKPYGYVSVSQMNFANMVTKERTMTALHSVDCLFWLYFVDEYTSMDLWKTAKWGHCTPRHIAALLLFFYIIIWLCFPPIYHSHPTLNTRLSRDCGANSKTLPSWVYQSLVTTRGCTVDFPAWPQASDCAHSACTFCLQATSFLRTDSTFEWKAQ